MAKVDQMISALKKMYSKRSALDKQILAAQNKLAAEAKAAAKAAPKKPAAKRRARRSAAAKSPVKK